MSKNAYPVGIEFAEFAEFSERESVLFRVPEMDEDSDSASLSVDSELVRAARATWN